MKKLLFFVLLMLFSCEKDDTYCYKCKRDVFAPEGYYSVVIEVCGMTEAEAREFEKDNSSIQGTVTIVMECTKNGL